MPHDAIDSASERLRLADQKLVADLNEIRQRKAGLRLIARLPVEREPNGELATG